MQAILEIQNIGKQYNIGGENRRYLSLRDQIVNTFSKTDKSKNTFWALKDISFDVFQGDSIGIIGRNGAGKSTLLKILSKITAPTTGFVKARGRVASLLEVGTGFHPELTGRENIYLNGSILGLSKNEINQKFDEIVDFSGVEKFLDTPLKHYSSGMQLRLAFAVAAHLEPEILVIDEVLAVGDAAFQKKCLGKMSEVSKSGRTILFVSHNMGAVQKLCNKGILLEKGKLKYEGKTVDVINHYLKNIDGINSYEIDLHNHIRKSFLNKNISFKKVRIQSESGEKRNNIKFGENFTIELEYQTNVDCKNIELILGIESLDETRIASYISPFFHYNKSNNIKASFTIKDLLLNPNTYQITLGCRVNSIPADHIVGALQFTITDAFDKSSIEEKPFNYGLMKIKHVDFYQNQIIN